MPAAITDHRWYVGGLWDEIGTLQFDYLVAQGLTPDDVLLDIGCGALRGGVHFIPYLQAGHYLGMEKEADLIRAAMDRELPPDVARAKRPEIVVSASFAFERFSRRPTVALAQSVFTHLTVDQVTSCLRRLRQVLEPDGRFFATFFVSSSPSDNPPVSDDHLCFWYTWPAIRRMAAATGWDAELIGTWHHPRGQSMVVFRPRETARPPHGGGGRDPGEPGLL